MYTGVKLRLKAMVNKEKSKVLFAEADSHFADILLSFLTLPLGRILNILKRVYGDMAPATAIRSLRNLQSSLVNLDSSYFIQDCTTMSGYLNGGSSFEDEYRRLKLDIADSRFIHCLNCGKASGVTHCPSCHPKITKLGSNVADDGVFTTVGTSFVITDDLQILPNKTGLFGIMSFLGITDMDEAEQTLVDFGEAEMVGLLKASLTSSTPLSDVILNRTTSAIKSPKVESQLIKLIKSPKVTIERCTQFANRFGDISLKVTIERCTCKIVHAQAKDNFMAFLLGLLGIPLGRVEQLQGGKTSNFKAINSLYRSAAELIDDKYFKEGMKTRLMNQDFPKESILPITRGPLFLFSSQTTYRVMDDLTVAPFSIMSMLTTLKEQKIAVSDVEEVELQIGLREGLSIVNASLTSTRVLTDALIKNVLNKRNE